MKEKGIVKSFKTRIYPTKEQKEYFQRCFGIRRWTWNWALNEYNSNDNITFSAFTYQKKLNNEVKESKRFPWLYGVNSMVRQESLVDLDQSIKRFKEKQNKNIKSDPKNPIPVNKFKPKFKSKKKSINSFRYNNKGNPLKFISNKYIRLTTIRGMKPFVIKSRESFRFLSSDDV